MPSLPNYKTGEAHLVPHDKNANNLIVSPPTSNHVFGNVRALLTYPRGASTSSSSYKYNALHPRLITPHNNISLSHTRSQASLFLSAAFTRSLIDPDFHWFYLCFRYRISSLFSVFSGILCSGTTMEITRHFGARAKERKLRTILDSWISEECRSTPVSAQKSPRRFQVYISENLSEKTFLFALLVSGRFIGFIYIV